MNRLLAMDRAAEIFDSGQFARDLARRVAFPTVSQDSAHAGDLGAYLEREIGPALGGLGFSCRIVENRIAPGLPLLIAERIEDAGPADRAGLWPRRCRRGHGRALARGADALAPRRGRRPASMGAARRTTRASIRS